MKLLRLFSLLLFLAIFILLIGFFLENDQPIDLSAPSIDYTITLPFYIIASAAFLLGLFFGNALFFRKSLTLKRALRRSEKRQKMLEEEITQLKAKQLTSLS